MSEMSTVDVPISTLCPQCGPKVTVDEDGCCVACGATSIGEGADVANTAIARIGELETLLASHGHPTVLAADSWYVPVLRTTLEGLQARVRELEAKAATLTGVVDLEAAIRKDIVLRFEAAREAHRLAESRERELESNMKILSKAVVSAETENANLRFKVRKLTDAEHFDTGHTDWLRSVLKNAGLPVSGGENE